MLLFLRGKKFKIWIKVYRNLVRAVLVCLLGKFGKYWQFGGGGNMTERRPSHLDGFFSSHTNYTLNVT